MRACYSATGCNRDARDTRSPEGRDALRAFCIYEEGTATSTNWTAAQLAALDAAIASGVLTVRYADREVTYQSTDAMLKARAVIAQNIAAAAGTSSTRYAAHSKGTC